MQTRQFLSAFALAVLSGSEVEQAFNALKSQTAEGRGYLLFFVVGAGHAYQRANARCGGGDEGISYCPPNKLQLNAQNFAAIALTEHETHPDLYQASSSSNPIEAIVNALGAGLERTFPCDTQCGQ